MFGNQILSTIPHLPGSGLPQKAGKKSQKTTQTTIMLDRQIHIVNRFRYLMMRLFFLIYGKLVYKNLLIS